MSNQAVAKPQTTSFVRTMLSALVLGVEMSRLVEEDRTVSAATMEKVRKLASR